MPTIDDLDDRTRYLESEIEGEKAVTRHVLQQATLNADDLATLKTGVRQVGEQMFVVNATLATHATRLNVLTQDVQLIRQQMTALRRELAAAGSDIARRLDGAAGRFDVLERRLGTFENSVAARLDAIERNVAAILTAVERSGATPSHAG